jgi:hypothetical protein
MRIATAGILNAGIATAGILNAGIATAGTRCGLAQFSTAGIAYRKKVQKRIAKRSYLHVYTFQSRSTGTHAGIAYMRFRIMRQRAPVQDRGELLVVPHKAAMGESTQ